VIGPTAVALIRSDSPAFAISACPRAARRGHAAREAVANLGRGGFSRV